MNLLVALCYAGFALGIFFYLIALMSMGTIIAMITVDVGHACMLTTIALLLLRHAPLHDKERMAEGPVR